MDFDGWIAIFVVLSATSALVVSRIGPDLILVAALTVLILLGILTPEEALHGFSNPGLATVAVLFVVVSGAIETGVTNVFAKMIMGRTSSVRNAQFRLMFPVSFLSAFLNNTPVVAMLVPAIQDWARRNQIAVSKLMIPLSFSAILGGTCSIIGTSTNLIVVGLLEQEKSMPTIGFFEIAWIGIPSVVIGVIYILIASKWLLPNREPAINHASDLKEYAVEMLVEAGSSLVGQSIENAGLRQLPSLYLAEIERGDAIIPVVSPSECLQSGDRLVFVGAVEGVVDLYQIRGLVPAPEQVFKLDSPRPMRQLVEAVVSGTSPFLGKTIKESNFRTRYEAVVIAVARAGRRIQGKIGEIELQVGDTLLLETRPSFVNQHRNSRDFLLISAIEKGKTPRHEKSAVALIILVMMICLTTIVGMPMLLAALLAAAAMIAFRCTSANLARANIDWSLLVVIGASISLGQALEQTGAAQVIASKGIDLLGQHNWVVLLAVYLMTNILTELITNNAAAVLMFPIAKAAALSLGVSFLPFVFAIMIAASASFSTPIGYQTNLMVFGPGGYVFSDYLKIGLPLNFILAALTVLIAPYIWPF